MNNPVARVVTPVTRLFAILCGWWLLGYSVLVCVDIVARRFFAVSLQGTDEIGGYTLAVVSAFGFAHALATRRHTRIDLFINALPPRPRALANAAAAITIAILAAFAASRGFAEASDSWMFNAVSTSPLQTPIWLPQGLWVAGFGLFAIVAVVFALHALWLAIVSPARANAWYGPPTVAEEIAAEGVPVMEGKR
jgi:TRAP-type C4-dicarboxylate transport system permease small subunit